MRGEQLVGLLKGRVEIALDRLSELLELLPLRFDALAVPRELVEQSGTLGDVGALAPNQRLLAVLSQLQERREQRRVFLGQASLARGQDGSVAQLVGEIAQRRGVSRRQPA